MTIKLSIFPAGNFADFFRQLIRALANGTMLTGPISQPDDTIRPVRNWIIHHG